MITTNRMATRIAAMAALPATLLLAGVAHAADVQDIGGTDLRELTVDYHDLNLASAHDRARLNHRLIAAAEQVCDYDRGARPLNEATIETRCYNNALADARARMAPVIAAAEARQKLAGR